MAVQTSYSSTHVAFYPGMIQAGNPYGTVSKYNANASDTVIAFGKGVVTSGEEGMDLPDSGSVLSEFIGVLAYELNHTQDGVTGGIAPDKTGTVVTFGRIPVTVLDTVTKDSDVYLRVGATGTGDFSGVVGTGDTLGIQITNAKFLTGGDAGDTVLIAIGIGG